MAHGFKGATNAMVRTFVFLGLAALTQAQTCSNASLGGTYFYLQDGTAGGSTGSPAPYAQFGKVISDGNGNLSGQATASDNGVISQLSFTGTYTVNADCSGTITTTSPRQSGSSYTSTSAVQLVRGGQEALFVTTDPGAVLTGRTYRAAAQGASQCGNGSLEGSYGWLDSDPRIVASLYPAGQASVGGVVFDGKGGFNYKATHNPAEAGLFSGQGTYSIAGDCSGTVVMSGGAANFVVAVIEGGDVLLLETDPDSLHSGIMQPDSPPSLLPQVAFGGGWYSALYFTNTTDAGVSFLVEFTANDGTPLIVPGLGCTQHGCPSGSSYITVSVPAQGTTIVEALNAGSLSQGYATFTLPSGVSGYGVFRQSVTGRPDQEAVAPFATANATSSTLVWDDTSSTTSVAMVNAGPVAATISITVWDNNGTVLGTSSVALPPYQKTAGPLRSYRGLAGMAGFRGKARFSATSGNVAVLGLRFGATAFTSIPAQQ